MTEDDDTKDLTEQMTDRQILLELRRTMGDLVERVTALERRTNPLPPNYDARFTSLEAVSQLSAAAASLRKAPGRSCCFS